MQDSLIQFQKEQFRFCSLYASNTNRWSCKTRWDDILFGFAFIIINDNSSYTQRDMRVVKVVVTHWRVFVTIDGICKPSRLHRSLALTMRKSLSFYLMSLSKKWPPQSYIICIFPHLIGSHACKNQNCVNESAFCVYLFCFRIGKKIFMYV